MSHRNYQQNPWDDSVYGTGPTQPPKSRGGLIAFLLILVIFLSGLIALLGIMNVKMFKTLKDREDQELAISFTAGVTVPAETVPAAIPETHPTEAPSDTFHLEQSPQSIDNVPQKDGLSLQEIYIRNIPSVASITCEHPGGKSTGTGVVFSEDGLIITNAHVVEGAMAISVQLTDERVLPAQVIGYDEISDLAVLEVDAQDLIPAQFGDSSFLRVGDTVVAIGDPLGVEFRGTYTDGIVSAINRDVDVDGQTMTLIQTNAALNSGNSGGPLINCFGQVIGINTMKIGTFTDSAGVEGLGFAIPSATVKEIVDQLIHQGYVSGRPTLGISGESLSMFYQHYYNLPAGLYITDVARGSDAARKGIEDGDILVSLEDIRISTMTEIRSILQNYEVGDEVTVIVYRAGQQYQLTLTLDEDKG